MEKGIADKASICLYKYALRAQGSKQKQKQDKWHRVEVKTDDQEMEPENWQRCVKKCSLVNKEIPQRFTC